MNGNSKNTKSETSTIFSENFSQKSKSAHSDMYDTHYYIKKLTEAQTLLEESESAIKYLLGLLKDILNGEYTHEEACSLVGEFYDIYLADSSAVLAWMEEHRRFLEHFEL